MMKPSPPSYALLRYEDRHIPAAQVEDAEGFSEAVEALGLARPVGQEQAIEGPVELLIIQHPNLRVHALK